MPARVLPCPHVCSHACTCTSLRAALCSHSPLCVFPSLLLPPSLASHPSSFLLQQSHSSPFLALIVLPSSRVVFFTTPSQSPVSESVHSHRRQRPTCSAAPLRPAGAAAAALGTRVPLTPPHRRRSPALTASAARLLRHLARQRCLPPLCL
ncbi:unnamed protein product [Closterium sp. NIES-53]